jgi:hypothetical protein
MFIFILHMLIWSTSSSFTCICFSFDDSFRKA